MSSAVEIVVGILGLHAACGLLFAVFFVVWGVGRIDPHAVDGSWGFRLLIVPASAVLWPWLLWRWLGGVGPPQERNAHRLRARAEERPS